MWNLFLKQHINKEREGENELSFFKRCCLYSVCRDRQKYGYILESVPQLNAMVLQAVCIRSNPPVQPRVVESSLLFVNTIITICTKERN